MQITEHLATVPLFQGLSDTYLEKLAMIVTDQDFQRGQTIFSEGDEGVGFYVILSGLVRVYKLNFEGKEQILHVLGPGEPFAEVAVLTGANFPAHAQALEQSRVLFFPRKSFVQLIREDPSLAMNMLAVLAMRLRKFASMIELLSLKEVPGRLATHLLLLDDQQEQAGTVRLNITKAHLASMLGTIPETLSRILKKMSQQGFVNIDGPIISILDRDGLSALAAGEDRI